MIMQLTGDYSWFWVDIWLGRSLGVNCEYWFCSWYYPGGLRQGTYHLWAFNSLTKKDNRLHPHKNLQTDAYWSFIYNLQDLQAMKISFNRRMDTFWYIHKMDWIHPAPLTPGFWLDSMGALKKSREWKDREARVFMPPTLSILGTFPCQSRICVQNISLSFLVLFY